MSNIDHILLFIFLFTVFYCITLNKQININKNFWKYNSIPIIVYSIILGCRYGWGNDFLWYKFRFEHPFRYEDESIGFRFVNLTIANLGLNYTVAFIIYSLTFIIGVFILLRFYKHNKYMLCLFLPATLLFSTATIRESFAASFAYIAYYFLFKKNYLGMALSLLCMNTIHSAPLLTFSLVTIIYLFNNRLLSIKYSIPLYIIIFFFSSKIENYIIEPLNNVLSLITLENKYQGYIEEADYWFSEEGKNSIYKQSTFTASLMFLFHISIIYIGYLGLKIRDNKYVRCFYHTVIIGFYLLNIFFELEILRRIAESLVQMYFIPVGYSISIISKLKHNILPNKLFLYYKFALAFFIIYLILYFGRFIFLSPSFKFFWNI